MKFFAIILLNTLLQAAYGQKLNISDLSRLTSLNLNDGESFLSTKKFEFKESLGDSSSSFFSIKTYAFAYKLDEYGDKADEFLLLSFVNNNGTPYKVWYQLSKDGWFNLKNSLSALGYKKTGTETESDGSLTTIYKRSKTTVYFNSGKGTQNDGQFVYIIYVIKTL